MRKQITNKKIIIVGTVLAVVCIVLAISAIHTQPQPLQTSTFTQTSTTTQPQIVSNVTFIPNAYDIMNKPSKCIEITLNEGATITYVNTITINNVEMGNDISGSGDSTTSITDIYYNWQSGVHYTIVLNQTLNSPYSQPINQIITVKATAP